MILTDNQKDFLRSQLEDYLQLKGVDTSKKSGFSCLICGSSNACNFVPKTNKTIWKCFSAKHSNYGSNGGDIFTYVEQLKNTDFTGACDILAREYNLVKNSKKIKKFTPPQKTSEQIDEERKIEEDRKFYKEFERQEVEKILNVLKDNPSEYLYQRGISYETQKRYNIGYLSNFVHPKILWNNRNNPHFRVYPAPRAIIPTSKGSILARAIRPQDEGINQKYKVLKVGETQVFNADILKENLGYCFCFEGEIDALSGIECGCNSIGLGSTSMIDKLFQKYEINHNNVLIIAMDNDDGGKNSILKFETLAKANKIPYIVADSNFLFNAAKDCNQALQEDKENLIIRLEEYKEKALTMDKTKLFEENSKIDETPIPQITYENIKSKEVLEYSYTLNDEIEIARYFDMLLTKSKEYRLVGFKGLISSYRKKALELLNERKRALKNQSSDGIMWDKDSQGRLMGTLNNYENILSHNDIYMNGLKYNEFDYRHYFNGKPITDDWITSLRLKLVRDFHLTNTMKSEVLDTVHLVSKYNSYHPIKNYLDSLPSWDKIPRLETLFIKFLGAEDNEYTRKIAKITMISAIARIQNAGCWVDTITCLVGQQGIGKSKFLQKLAVNKEWFNDGITSFDGKEFYEGIQGKWIIELGEGTAFKKSTKEIAKQRASATKDTYRTPYASLPEDRPRQCIFIATVNDYKFLKDETGNRRYYPIDCKKSKATANFNDLTHEYVAQLWAEALELYNQDEKWYLDESEKNIIEMAINEQQNHYETSGLYDDMYNFLRVKVPKDWYKLPLSTKRNHIHSVLADTHGTYVDGTPIRLAEECTREYISIKEIFCEYFDKEPNETFSGDEKLKKNIAQALKELGYKSTGKNHRKYVGGYGQLIVYTKED